MIYSSYLKKKNQQPVSESSQLKITDNKKFNEFVDIKVTDFMDKSFILYAQLPLNICELVCLTWNMFCLVFANIDSQIS